MKRWVLALVLSLAVHLGALASFELSPAPAVGEKTDAVVPFTTVSLEREKKIAPAAALEKPRAVHASLVRQEPALAIESAGVSGQIT